MYCHIASVRSANCQTESTSGGIHPDTIYIFPFTFTHSHQTQDEFFHQSHATSFSVNKKDRTGEKIKREKEKSF